MFKSFQSTVARFVRGRSASTYHVLEDPVTGAPTGLQSNNANGPDGIWTPIDLTAAQIAAPTADMVADLNAQYRLNIAPYSRYRSDGTTLVAAPSGGILTLVDPTTETENATFITRTILNTDNAQDVLTVVGRNWFLTQGFHDTSQHSAGFYGEATPFDTKAGGTMDYAPAFVGVSGNQGLGTVTNAVDFMSHADINNSGGTLTNHFALFQQTGTGAWANGAAKNEYGFAMMAPSGIGTTAPTAYFDVLGADTLTSSVLLLIRNSSANILKITADGAITGAVTVNNPGTTILYAPLRITVANAPFIVFSTVSVRALPA